jgi:hypothetical protein
MTTSSSTFSTPILDLRFRHAIHKRGDIEAWITWNRHTGSGCLVLLRSNRRISHETVIPCIIDEQNAWRWHDVLGDPDYQVQMAALFAPALGLPPFPESIHRVIGIVQDLVGELANIPLMPTDGETHVADAFIRDQDGRETHQEIRDHV